MQILVLSCVEFEGVGKLLAQSADTSFNMKSNIVEITKTVLKGYPQIIDTEVYTDYRKKWKPLGGWKLNVTTPNNPSVSGLDWWKDYNGIKHQGFDNFYRATLDNAIESLASLNVLELYLMKKELGNLNIAMRHPCGYFDNDYISRGLCTEEGNLPDFGNTSNTLVDNETLKIDTL